MKTKKKKHLHMRRHRYPFTHLTLLLLCAVILLPIVFTMFYSFFPNVSFLGHLCGILAGYLYLYLYYLDTRSSFYL